MGKEFQKEGVSKVSSKLSPTLSCYLHWVAFSDFTNHSYNGLPSSVLPWHTKSLLQHTSGRIYLSAFPSLSRLWAPWRYVFCLHFLIHGADYTIDSINMVKQMHKTGLFKSLTASRWWGLTRSMAMAVLSGQHTTPIAVSAFAFTEDLALVQATQSIIVILGCRWSKEERNIKMGNLCEWLDFFWVFFQSIKVWYSLISTLR